jgi:hypothetical protein
VNALQKVRALLGAGNALPEGEPRRAYELGLTMAAADPPEPPTNWQELAYAHGREVARLRTALAGQLTKSLPDLLDKQAGGILRNLEAWCSAKPGRGFRVSVGADGRWSASLIECERRTAQGENLADALGQIAQVASYETK